MAGRRIAALLLFLVLPAFLLVFLPGTQVKASTWNSTYVASLANPAPGANSDSSSLYTILAPSPNFAQVFSTTGATANYSALDVEIPNGASVGDIISQTKLGLLNGPCNTHVTVDIDFSEATTDIFNTMAWVDDGSNLAKDNNGNGLSDYVDYYPSYLNELFDPDGSGNLYPDPSMPLRPRARYAGHSVVTAGAPPTQLNFVVFNPGQLSAMPAPMAGLGDERGYLNVAVLNNPTTGAPTSITDFCSDLSSAINLKGLTQGENNTLWADKHELQPWETTWPTNQCANTSDDDGDCPLNPLDPNYDTNGDGIACNCLAANPAICDYGVNEGCVVIPDPCNSANDDPPGTGGPSDDNTVDEGCYYVRAENAAPLTGVYGTGTHLSGTWSQAQRDMWDPIDTDGIENALDTCPLATNAGNPRVGASGDTDSDGLDNVCDPKPNDPSAGAPANCPTGVQGLPDEDQDCYPNRGDNCPLVRNGYETDTVQVGLAPETPAQCVNNVDDDGDTTANDGCLYCTGLVGPVGQGIDDDNDGVADDGCPAGPPPAALALDQDEKPSAADGGPFQDQIGDECEPDWNGDTIVGTVPGARECISGAADCTGNPADHTLSPTRSDGHTHPNMPLAAVCIPDPYGADDTDGNGNSDNDGDGWCDSTEDLLGSDKDDAAGPSVPEYTGLEYDSLPGPDLCSDYTTYNHPDAGPIDNDNDTLANAADLDTCVVLANDTDQDGVDDTFDNCINDDNPGQVDSDGDGQGDACDTDDDNDGIDDQTEGYLGTDPKNNCAQTPLGLDDPNPYDLAKDQSIDVGDILMYKPVIMTNVGPGTARYDLAPDQSIDVGDILMFKPVIMTTCDTVLTFHNFNTGVAVNDLHVEFFSEATTVVGAVDDTGTVWSLSAGQTLPAYQLNFERPGGMPESNTVTINLKGKRPPVVRCYDWTVDGNVVNSSPKPCRFHQDAKIKNAPGEPYGTNQTAYDLHVEMSDPSFCCNKLVGGQYVYKELVRDGKKICDYSFPQGLLWSSVLDNRAFRPGHDWEVDCWYWTDINGTPLTPLSHCPIDKEVMDIRFDYAYEYPYPGPEIVGNFLEIPWYPGEQTKVSVMSYEVNNGPIVPWDAQVNFYANIPPGCQGKWVWEQTEPPYPPGPFWPYDTHTRFGDPYAEPMSPEQKGMPISPYEPKFPGDEFPGEFGTYEADLHFQTWDYYASGLYFYYEEVGTPIEILRFFDLECFAPGVYEFWFCNKIEAKKWLDNDGDTMIDEDEPGGIDAPEPIPDPDWTNNLKCEPLTVSLP